MPGPISQSDKNDRLYIHSDVSDGQIYLAEGDPVEVLRDDGTREDREVKYAPWQLGDGTWVVGLRGISGGYALCRVRPRRLR
jgi:hypothetical protein